MTLLILRQYIIHGYTVVSCFDRITLADENLAFQLSLFSFRVFRHNTTTQEELYPVHTIPTSTSLGEMIGGHLTPNMMTHECQ